MKLDSIRPGKPVENGFIESFNGTLRDECLNTEIFSDVADARQKLERWRRDYDEHRPHSAIGEMAPLACLRRVAENQWEPRQANFLLIDVSSDWV